MSAKGPRHFDDFVQAWIRCGEDEVRAKFRCDVLFGLYIVADFAEIESIGPGGARQSSVENLRREVAIRHRVLPIRKIDNGPGCEHIRLGRLEHSNDIVIDELSVSPVHADISRDDNGVWITDLGSKHGTRVGGDFAVEGQPLCLEDGAKLIIGRAKFEYVACESFLSRVAEAAHDLRLRGAA